jgi:hypothetical protein
VAPAAHRQKNPVLASEVHRGDDIGDPSAAGDERRFLVDHAVPDLAGLVVALVAGSDQLALQPGLQVGNERFFEDGGLDFLLHDFSPFG